MLSWEVPGGWLGTIFNDYFEVSIECGPQGPVNAVPAHVSTSSSIGQLGQYAFDSNGATYYYRLSIESEKLKDKTCEVGISVADAIDHLVHSAVCAKAYYVSGGNGGRGFRRACALNLFLTSVVEKCMHYITRETSPIISSHIQPVFP